jgi:hypothetical protein
MKPLASRILTGCQRGVEPTIVVIRDRDAPNKGYRGAGTECISTSCLSLHKRPNGFLRSVNSLYTNSYHGGDWKVKLIKLVSHSQSVTHTLVTGDTL